MGMHLNRGYDDGVVRSAVAVAVDITTLVRSQEMRPGGEERLKKLKCLGLCWPVEQPNSWLTNFGQLRRHSQQRPAQLALAVALSLTAKLINWRLRSSRA